MRRVIYCVASLLIWISGASFGLCQSDREGASSEAVLHQRAGNVYLKQKKPSLAIHEYEQAIALTPSSTASYFNLAIAYYAERNIPQAISALEKLTELAPNDGEAHYNLACLKLYLQKIDKAKLHFEKAKLCCRNDPGLASLIAQGLEFVQELKEANPSTRDVLFFLSEGGFPPLVSTA